MTRRICEFIQRIVNLLSQDDTVVTVYPHANQEHEILESHLPTLVDEISIIETPHTRLESKLLSQYDTVVTVYPHANQKREILENHLLTLVKEISINETPHTRLEVISPLVKQLVHFLVDNLKLLDAKPRLKVKEIIPTGSCYDGTKIMAPDEFDYLVVVDIGADITAVSTRSDGFAQIEATSHYESSEDFVTVDNVASSTAFRIMFRRLFHSVVTKNTGIRFRALHGYLLLEGYSVPINGPQCSLRARWIPKCGDSLEIFIDVTPAIKCVYSKGAINLASSANGYIEQILAKSKHVFLIPRPHPPNDRCYKLVFDEADKSVCLQLHDTHHKCLKLLKYFSILIQQHDFRFKKVFNSFSMKMAVFHHVKQCKEISFVSCCLQKIIGFLLECLKCDRPTLQSVFTPGRNIWNNLDTKSDLGADDRNIAVDILKTIEIYINLNKSAGESFDDFRDNIQAACRHVCNVGTKRTPKPNKH